MALTGIAVATPAGQSTKIAQFDAAWLSRQDGNRFLLNNWRRRLKIRAGDKKQAEQGGCDIFHRVCPLKKGAGFPAPSQ